MPRLLRYVRRHVGADMAPDVVAESFSVAWRRWETVPDPALPWLIGTARKVIANDVRAVRRRRRLTEQLKLLQDVTGESAFTVDPTDRLEALQILGALKEPEREALLLTAWDGLSDAEAALAMGIKAPAFRQRLSRARRRLAASSSHQSVPAHVLEDKS